MDDEKRANINHLRFICQMDHEKQRDYVQLLFRIMKVELGDENGEKKGWRASFPHRPNHHQRPWVPAKIGYLNKLETEGIIYRKKISNSKSIFALDIDMDEFLTELGNFSELLDEDNPFRDLEF